MPRRKIKMMHFRADESIPARLQRAVDNHPDRYDSQSDVIRQAIRYYLGRLEAGALQPEPEPEPPLPPSPESRRLRAVPPHTRSTDVAQ